MPFNINNIRANLVGGGARPTLFQVVITNPINPVADLAVPFMVQAASLPSWNLGTIEVPYMGRKIKEAGDRTFEPWTVTVMNDESFNIRDAIESWNNAINRLERNVRDTGSSNSLSYKSQAVVSQLSKTGSVIREYQFNGMYPAIIAPIDLDWNNTDTIETFTVTFDYDDFYVIPGATGNAGGS